YEYDTEHPPLARVLLALGPFLAGAHSFGTPPPDGTQEGIDILYDGGQYERTLTLARLGALPFLALLLWAAWLWARRVNASEGEALLAVLLLASVPPILGHAALAALDIPGTATTLLALYLLQSWIVSGSRRDAILFGLAAGVAVGTKLSAVPYIGLGGLVLALTRLALRQAAWPASGWWRRLGGSGLALLALAVPIVLAYGRRSIDLTELPPRFAWVLPYLFHGDSAAHPTVYSILTHVRLPEAFWDFAEGIVALKAHNDTGHLSFLLGQLQKGGWWYFYLVALAVKTPLPLLATGPLGMGLLARDGWRERDAWRLAPAVLFLTLLTFASTFSRINIGIRHVLILYPFMALGGAHAVARAWKLLRALPNRVWARSGSALLAALVAWQLALLWRANPDYFPYFNELAPHPERVLVDSDLDWGQDLRRLERRLAELQIPRVSLAYQGTADLAREVLPPFVRLPPWQPATGWVAITALAREHEPRGYAWLDAYRPLERVGKTIDLYFIPEPGAPAQGR
ncbi:MAG TPA: glycosyltransferase family 39 protein, partial [Steroidobacteraceae bacterium]|nr:glycosyltransferase family 39 protein [Steroidobacteraceae bacterium]